MNAINEVSLEQIERLTDLQLTELLHKLLYSEALKLGLVKYEISVPLKINVADGGEDGRIEWDDKNSYKWIKKSPSLFQNKATVMGPKKCYEEIIENGSKTGKELKLKSQILDIIAKKGCYTLFTNISLNTSQIKARIKSFEEAITDCGKNTKNIKIDVYDANKIKDWVNENIAAITFVQECNKVTRLSGFRTWKEWKDTWSFSQITYQKDDKINSYIDQIRSTISKENILRVIGHSGLGKTRLVFEAFRIENDSKFIKSLQNQVVYYDLGLNGLLPDLINYISSHRNQTGIMIIDNCDEHSHNALNGIIKSTGKLKLITIDLITSTDEPSHIRLDRNDQKNVVKELVNELFSKILSKSELEYLADKAEGYPQMVILFSESLKKNDGKSILQELPEEFLKKLVFGRHNENENEFDIIKACSIFSNFGFLDDTFESVLTENEKKSLQSQMDYIRQVVCENNVSEKKFYNTCLKYKSTNIIEQRGTSLMVKPTPLAMSLAAQWWRETPPNQIKAMLAELQGQELGLKLVERLKELDQLDKAKQIVNDLWGINSPFGTAEVLNTELGSLLFRNIVDVNPTATAETLYYLFGKLSKEELLKIDQGRRNLVWALEKLCFRKESFYKAAIVLYNFAVAENETWGNNSTNQFKQLFQIFLPGTEVNYDERLKVIEYGLSKDDLDYTKIAVKSLGHGLTTHYFTRMGGAEKQGSSAPLADYRPHNVDEVYNYRKNILALLKLVMKKNPNLANEIKDIISQSIRTIFSQGQETLIKNIIEEIHSKENNVWLSAINALKSTLHYEKQITPDAKKIAQDLIEYLTPSDLENQFILKVSKPEWDSFEKDENGHFIDKPRINAESFAEYLVENNIDWHIFIPNLLKGEQRQSFSFGYKMCELIEDKQKLILESLEVLKTIPESDQNIEFIGGLLWQIRNDKIKDNVLDYFLESSEFNIQSFYFVKMLEPNFEDLKKFLNFVNKNKISTNYFKSFAYGRPLENLSSNDLIEICKGIIEIDNNSTWVVLSILFMYCYSSPARWTQCKDYVAKIISSKNMLLIQENIDNMDGYHWSESVKKILEESDKNKFAIAITTQIVQLCKSPRDKYSFDHEIKEILPNLFSNYFEDVWEIFGNGLLEDSLTFIKLKFILESKNGNFHEKGGFHFISEHDYESIINWCKNNKPKAPLRIAYLMPISDVQENKIVWHPFALRMIDEFGDLDGFLNELSANMGSFGFTGSVIPYYEEHLTLFNLLTKHKKRIVCDWADKMIMTTKKIIMREKLNEEDRY